MRKIGLNGILYNSQELGAKNEISQKENLKLELRSYMRQDALWFLSQTTQTYIPTLTLPIHVLLDKLLRWSMPKSPHL